MFLASLPWYDFPEVYSATNELWDFFRKKLVANGIQAPLSLCRNIPYREQWKLPNLLFSQACGYDVAKPFANNLQIIATPCYDVPGCEEHQYSSFIVVHKNSDIHNLENVNNSVCAINENESHSGKNIFYFVLSQIDNPTKISPTFILSGSHENSIKMVASKQVDIACIDCVSFYILQKYRPHFIEDLRIILQTPHAPAPPYVTSVFRSERELSIVKQSFLETIKSPETSGSRKKLFLKNIHFTEKKDYSLMLDCFTSSL